MDPVCDVQSVNGYFFVVWEEILSVRVYVVSIYYSSEASF